MKVVMVMADSYRKGCGNGDGDGVMDLNASIVRDAPLSAPEFDIQDGRRKTS